MHDTRRILAAHPVPSIISRAGALGLGLAAILALAPGSARAQIELMGETGVGHQHAPAIGAEMGPQLALMPGAAIDAPAAEGDRVETSSDGEQCYDANGVLDVINPINLSAKVGVAGMGLYSGAAGETTRRNHMVNPVRPWRRLNSKEKAALRPIFGNLVDDVTVTYNAILMTQIPIEWSVTPIGPTIRLATFTLDDATIGQTFGLDIYIRSPDPGRNATQGDLELLAHEMQHSKQYDLLHRNYPNFGYYYFYNWARVGFDYASNCMEVEARTVAANGSAAAFQRYQAAP